MTNSRLYRVLKSPVSSEKAHRIGEKFGVQVFKVDKTATKLEIKRAVELLFDGVQVLSVNTLNVKGKTRRFGKVVGKRNDYKKAYITLISTGSDADADTAETATQDAE